MISTLHLSSTALIRRMLYRHGFPFIMSTVLAIVTTAWPLSREALFHKGTSIWTVAILATVSTAISMLCGGPFRTFYVAIAVTPPFLIFFGWFLRLRFAIPNYPFSKAVAGYFLYFVAAPILLVWIITTLLNRKERHA
jgi:hypothetical protein